MNDAVNPAGTTETERRGFSLSTLAHLRFLSRYAHPYRRQILAAAGALLVAAACFIVVGQGLKRVIDEGFVAANPHALNQALLTLLAIVGVMAAATYARFYFVSWLGERVIADLRRDVFDHLLRLSPGFFEATRTGELISRLTADTALLETVIGSSVSMALRNTVVGAGSLGMLFLTSAKLTLLVLVGVPAVLLPILFFGRRVRKLSRASQDRVADLGAHIDETLHEIRVVQAYVHESVERRHFAQRIEAAFATAVDRIRSRGALIAAVIVVVFGGVAAILWVGGHDVLAGRISAGELSAFVFYATLVASACGSLSEVVGDLQRGAGAAERLLEILRTEPQIRAPARPEPLPEPARGEVTFDNVTFCYPSRPRLPALGALSLAVARGEKLALVGPSGAGKSTVFQLLLRFYDPDTGVIRLDGVDLRAADPLAVRSRIALVPQEPAIFAASVAENVRYGRPDANDDAVRAACAIAFADEFVTRLPQGYETYLGERGVRLSGGQKQRLAIARAVLADRPILLLDEATSALDSASERMVQAALERLMEGRTTLVIAHRLSTVQRVDRIAVIEHGRLVAIGRHAELIATSPLYARLAELQFGL
ncbi:MAG TPA: ABC transporter transmembrane domain-containing protein [Burkholderiales bacterium]|nr:ATP-binding cassette domain-containing protein [Betaproteobacteria bacterium]HQR52199.1 ABC transporter transmembrane domain-containing protein [Burkholderiales bacterium]